MKTKKINIILLFLTLILMLLFLINKDAIFQEGNPIRVLRGIIQLNNTNTFVKINDDNPIAYVTKTNNSKELFDYIEKEYDVVFKEQMGSGYIFEGKEKSVILTSKQYSRFYQIWGCFQRDIINLDYSTVQAEILKEGILPENLIYEKSITLENLFGKEEVIIDLYYEKINDTSDRPFIYYAFLQFNNKLYNIGNVSNYGLENLSIESVDRNFDGKNEIEIVGELGATYIEMKLISYNAETKELVNLLTMGSPKLVDLDQDGKDELLGVSVGSIPGYVDIYRWNEDHFEKIDVSESTKSTFVNLEYINDIWYFVTANDSNGELNYRYFIYSEGVLLEH